MYRDNDVNFQLSFPTLFHRFWCVMVYIFYSLIFKRVFSPVFVIYDTIKSHPWC